VPAVIDVFPGVPRGWGYAEHILRGYQGGTDVAVTASGTPVRAPATGRGVFVNYQSAVDGNRHGSVTITLEDGRKVQIIELRPLTRQTRQVVQGEIIGYTSNLYPHFHGFTAAGKRVPIESFYTTGSGGGITPIEGFLMALSDAQQDEIYAWMKGIAFGRYPAEGQVAEKLTRSADSAQDASETLNKPSTESGQYRPFDVVISQVKGTYALVSKDQDPVHIDVDALADAIVAKMPAGTQPYTPKEIAQAVRAEIIKD